MIKRKIGVCEKRECKSRCRLRRRTYCKFLKQLLARNCQKKERKHADSSVKVVKKVKSKHVVVKKAKITFHKNHTVKKVVVEKKKKKKSEKSEKPEEKQEDEKKESATEKKQKDKDEKDEEAEENPKEKIKARKKRPVPFSASGYVIHWSTF